MSQKLSKIVFTLLFLFILGTRLYFSVNLNYFSDDQSYFHLKHIEHLAKEKNFLVSDGLSYGGREILYPKVYSLVLALLSLGDTALVGILSEFLIALLFVIIYLTTIELTNNQWASLFSATLASFFPLLYKETFNVLSVYNLEIIIIFFSFLCFMKLKEPKFRFWFVVSIFTLAFMHISSLILLLILAFYFFILVAEGFPTSKIEKEAGLFSMILIPLGVFITYKKAFLVYGLDLIRQNIPESLLSTAFKHFDFTYLPFMIGILPIICGSIGIYFSLFRSKSKNIHLYSAMILSIILLLVLRLIPFTLGVLFIGIVLAIFSAYFILWLDSYIVKTKFSNFYPAITTALIVLIIIFSIVPSVKVMQYTEPINKEYVRDFTWIKENTKSDVNVLTNVFEGNMLNYFGKRKNIVDSYFILAPNPNERLKDIDVIYSSGTTQVDLKLLKKYNIQYIYLSDATKRYYKIREVPKLEGCIEKVHDSIYEVKC